MFGGDFRLIFILGNKDWDFGEDIIFRFGVVVCNGDIIVLLLGFVLSIYGNFMGVRMIFFVVFCLGILCIVIVFFDVYVCLLGWY